VLIDGRPLVGNRTGIGVHTAEIAGRLRTLPLIASHAVIENRQGLDHCAFRVDHAPVGLYWQQAILPEIEGDVLWGPHGTLPFTWRRPAVVSIHDFTSITMPGRHRLKTILSFNLFIGRSLEIASRVACVSRLVADETIRGFGVPAEKIEIVPNGVDPFFAPGGDEQDYILFTGTLEPRKGIDDLVAVWSSLPEPRPRLILAGDEGWKTKVPDGAEAMGFVSRERLRELYRGARAFVYPSRYEGFGIPPLEAMACGTPVIATRTGAIPEFAGDAAVLIDPGDRSALRDALMRVLRDAGLRRELRTRGPERARRYDWNTSANLISELLGCV
jgi:glycosyltransferase involved in cell wall biosynthesis